MRGVFVTGTDTGVGKTVVSAWILRALNGEYWKPVQTGAATGNTGGDADEDSDTLTVKRLSGLPADRFHDPAHVFAAPLSPHAAAAAEGAIIELTDFTLPMSSRPIVVEGAGGVLVPLNGTDLMIDLMARLDLPVVLVARGGLGTINHSLLSIEALRARRLAISGIVFCGPTDPENRRTIETLGGIHVIGELPHLDPLDEGGIEAAVKDNPPSFSREMK